MSRTYKDRPFRVSGADKNLKNAHEGHVCREHDPVYFSRKECNLNEVSDPVRKYDNCYRYSMGAREHMRKDDLRLYHKSHRSEKRAIVNKMIREYNSVDEVSEDYVFTPHVKNALFGGGHWN